jgi:hypothetical protein
LQRNLNLFDLLLNEIHIWEILENEHKSLAIEILARLIANAAADNHNREKIMNDLAKVKPSHTQRIAFPDGRRRRTLIGDRPLLRSCVRTRNAV